MPTSISISSSSCEPASPAARESCSTLRGSSTATVIRWSRASAAIFRTLSGCTTWFATRTSPIPPVAITSASHAVAHAMPTAPASTSSSASSMHLCTLMCGRSDAGSSRNFAAIDAMFRFATSRSTISAGVATSLRCRPIWLWYRSSHSSRTDAISSPPIR